MIAGLKMMPMANMTATAGMGSDRTVQSSRDSIVTLPNKRKDHMLWELKVSRIGSLENRRF